MLHPRIRCPPLPYSLPRPKPNSLRISRNPIKTKRLCDCATLRSPSSPSSCSHTCCPSHHCGQLSMSCAESVMLMFSGQSALLVCDVSTPRWMSDMVLFFLPEIALSGLLALNLIQAAVAIQYPRTPLPPLPSSPAKTLLTPQGQKKRRTILSPGVSTPWSFNVDVDADKHLAWLY